jgi:multidrug resistance protein MdtO
MDADALAVRERPEAAARFERFWTWLRSELAPFPGRGAATLRMTIACLVIVTISMALKVPQAYLSAFFVFFISKEDVVTTTITGVALTVALVVGFGITILAYLITVDHPPLRLALMALIFCAAMYASRVFVLGPVAFGIGIIVLISQQFVDLYSEPEMLVRGTLWTWVVMAFPIAVILTVNRVIVPTRPAALLREEAKLRLGFVIDALDRRLAGLSVEATAPFGSKVVGAARLLGLLKLSASGDPAIKSRLPAYQAVIGTLNRIIEAAGMLGAVRPAVDPPQDRARMALLRAALDDLRRSLDGDVSSFRSPLKPAASVSNGAGPLAPILEEMERHLAEIAGQLQELPTAATAPAASGKSAPPRRLFVSDALTNPVYLQFGLKVTVAAMLCYIAYTAIDWPGIHTCTITCVVVALSSAGATLHRASLRLLGALIGGGLAILATVFVVPHLESIGGLLLMILPVAVLAGWVTSGSERISYCGVQIAMAFFYGVLEAYMPTTDVTHARDRLVGIVLGIAVMAVIFNYVWPERAEEQMRAALAKALRAAAALLRRHGGPASGTAGPSITVERSAIFENLVLAQRLAEVALFEPAPGVTVERAGTDAELVAASQATAISSLQAAQLRAENPVELDAAGQHLLKAYDNAVAAVLRRVADRLEVEPLENDLEPQAAPSRLSEFERRHAMQLKAIDSESSRGVAGAYRDLVARVEWLSYANPPTAVSP